MARTLEIPLVLWCGVDGQSLPTLLGGQDFDEIERQREAQPLRPVAIPLAQASATGPQVLFEGTDVRIRAAMASNEKRANSPTVAKAYLGFSEALSAGTLPARLREQISLVVGETNGCGYCVAAHTALGKGAGLTEQETCDARLACSSCEKEQAALEFARKVVQDRGVVSDDDVERLRQAGYTDGEIAEIVANVALNIFTNYFNHVAGTEVDFPAAPSLAAA